MFLANKLNRGAGVPTPVDAQFNYVTMLLHGDGTNGAQNNTFLDSSTNNFTITRNGNTTQGSFSPYGSNWSNYFDGSISSAYLSVATNTAFNCGTGNFTVEAWVNITAYTGSYPLIIGNNNGSFSAGAIALTSQNATSGGASKISFTAYDINSSGVTLAATSTNTIGGWTHFAVVRNGTSLVLYINGVSSASTTISAGVSLDFGKNGLLIGGGNWDTANGYYAGYISNLRLVKGTAVYTSAFTPSTTPLTAISGTSLLTCQSNRFVDNSTNNFAVTINSTPSVQRFNPFGTSTAYSTSVIGGSGYFGVGGSKLSTTGMTALGSDFTLEVWVYPTSFNDYNTIFDNRLADGDPAGLVLGLTSASKVYFYTNASFQITTTTALSLNTWTHIALVRSGSGSGNVKIYINGVADATTATYTTSFTSTAASVGDDWGTRNSLQYFGYLANFRTTTSAVYTSTFTPPTAPVTAISGTSLLLNMTNGAIFDNAMMNNLETMGNAQISTSVKKYGTGSMSFDGTGDYLKNATSPVITLSGNFTIECWLYINSTAVAQPIISFGTSGSISNLLFLYNTSVGLRWYFSSGTIDINQGSTSGWATGTWYHVAAVRSGSTLTLYRNGTSIASGTTTQTYQTNSQLNIGGSPGDSVYLDGYIDDFRITNGYARYTSNFTAPTAAFSDTGPY